MPLSHLISISWLFSQYLPSWALENETTTNGHFFFFLVICRNQQGREGFLQSLEVGRSALNPDSATCQLCDSAKVLSLLEPGLFIDGAYWKCVAVLGQAKSPWVRLCPFQKKDRTTSRNCPSGPAGEVSKWCLKALLRRDRQWHHWDYKMERWLNPGPGWGPLSNPSASHAWRYKQVTQKNDGRMPHSSSPQCLRG